MGQFKPMVKMETTEPSVELKLKSGGEVKKQMGGAMGRPAAMAGMPARGGMMPAAAPRKPSMAARRRAMMAMPAGAAPAGPVGGAGRMMKEGGESKAEHKAEMTKMASTAKKLQEHASKPASKAHKGLKTGGVANAQGGYAMGGSVRTTKVDTATPDNSPAKTGGVKLGNGGGYATGGVAKANGGGYKTGGAAKKAYATGGRVDSGAPVAMPQGRKPPSKPVSIDRLSGTFKDGGKVDAYDQIKSMDIPAEAKSRLQQAENEKAYKAFEEQQKRGEPSISDMLSGIPSAVKRMFNRDKAPGSVTKTEKAVTVEPVPKKRGGAC
jgi:hypothetical protein